MIFGGSPLFDALGMFVIAAALTALLGRWVRLPSLVSFIAAGLLIGPVTGLAEPATVSSEALDLLGEMGIVLLMFIVGTELSLERLRQVGRVSVAAGLGQVLFTAAIGFGISLALGFQMLDAIFIATALTFSSTAVVVKLLDQKQELQAMYGQIAVGIFLVQDVVVILALTMLSGLGSPEALTARGIAEGLVGAFAGMGLLLAVSLLGARYFLPRALAWAAGAPRTLFISSLAWCLTLVVVAHRLDLSVEIGAFLAGLAIAQLPFADELRRRTHPLMSFFIAIFFVSLGAQMQFEHAGHYWVESLVLALFVLIGNPLIFMLIIARFGYSERTAFLTSVTVAQISEFSFVFAAMGMSAGLIDEAVLSVIGIVGIVTIAVSAYMIFYNHQLYAWLQRRGILRVFRAKEGRKEHPAVERRRNHVIVVGMNELGRRVVHLLHAEGKAVLAVDIDVRKLDDLPCATLAGDIDYGTTLEEAGLRDAQAAISTLRIESANKLFVFRCKSEGIPVAVYAEDTPTGDQLREVGATHVVDSRKRLGQRIVATLKQVGAGSR